MHYNSLHALPPQDDLVDERWDDNRECYNQPESTLKNLDVLFQNLNLNRDQHRTTTPILMKKVSPLDVSYEKNNLNNDGLCFKEDMTSDDDDDDDDDDDYIVDNKMYIKQHNNTCYPTIKIDLATPIATTPLTTPSMITEAEEKHEYLATTYITQPTDQEDFSIMPLNEVEDYEEVNEELALDECVTATTTSDRLPPSFDDETNVYSTSPFNLCTYHSDLIQYYMDIILSKTAPDAISPLVTETLPDTYKQYLKDIQESCL